MITAALRRMCGGLAVLSLAGCVSAIAPPRVEVAPTTPALPMPAPLPTAATGSIYQQGHYRPLFEDHRARLPGDTLTISIVEKVTAVQKSTSNIDKSGSVSAGITALPGVKPTSFARASAEGNSSNTFTGKGSTESSNDFSGTITVTVREVLPNGHLLVAGEKQIGVQHNVDVLRFSGQVDPRAIQAGNSVPSTSIANVRLEQRGKGAQAEAQAIGWLARIFLTVLPL
jgi:flagellar L-ring protein precursor FlgH